MTPEDLYRKKILGSVYQEEIEKYLDSSGTVVEGVTLEIVTYDQMMMTLSHPQRLEMFHLSDEYPNPDLVRCTGSKSSIDTGDDEQPTRKKMTVTSFYEPHEIWVCRIIKEETTNLYDL